MEVKRVPGWDGTKEDTELYHHGIKGQRWGVRRYQNPDGSYTGEGRRRYQKTLNDLEKKRGQLKYEITKATRRSNLARYGRGKTDIDIEFGGEKSAKKWDTKKKLAEQQLKEVNAATKKTVDAAVKNNYKIDIAVAAKGKNYANGKKYLGIYMLGGIVPGALYAAKETANGSVQRLDKYKVDRRAVGENSINYSQKNRHKRIAEKQEAYNKRKSEAGKVYYDAMQETKKKRKE